MRCETSFGLPSARGGGIGGINVRDYGARGDGIGKDHAASNGRLSFSPPPSLPPFYPAVCTGAAATRRNADMPRRNGHQGRCAHGPVSL